MSAFGMQSPIMDSYNIPSNPGGGDPYFQFPLLGLQNTTIGGDIRPFAEQQANPFVGPGLTLKMQQQGIASPYVAGLQQAGYSPSQIQGLVSSYHLSPYHQLMGNNPYNDPMVSSPIAQGGIPQWTPGNTTGMSMPQGYQPSWGGSARWIFPTDVQQQGFLRGSPIQRNPYQQFIPRQQPMRQPQQMQAPFNPFRITSRNPR